MNLFDFAFGGPGALPWRYRLRRARARFAFRSVEKRGDIYEMLAQFTEDGLGPKEAIRRIHKRREERGDVSAVMTGEWLNALGGARSVAQAIAPWVPPIEAVLIAVGESTGRLSAALSEVASLAARRSELVTVTRQHTRKALTAWSLVLAIMVMISQFLAPKLNGALPRKEWSLNMALYFHFMHATEVLLPYLLFTVAILLAWAMWSRPRWCGRARAFFDRFPPWSLYREVEGAWMLVALASLMRAKVAPADALKRIMGFNPPYIRQHLARMRRRMERGDTEGEAMDTGLLPREMADLLVDYGGSVGFAKGVESIGRKAVKRTAKAVTATAASIESVAWLVLLGLMFWTISAVAGIAMSALSSARIF